MRTFLAARGGRSSRKSVYPGTGAPQAKREVRPSFHLHLWTRLSTSRHYALHGICCLLSIETEWRTS